MTAPKCTFSIPRGETARYVYIFDYYGSYYRVTKKVLLGPNYTVMARVIIPTNLIQVYINTVVATTY
jgi:hypothetical protein